MSTTRASWLLVLVIVGLAWIGWSVLFHSQPLHEPIERAAAEAPDDAAKLPEVTEASPPTPTPTATRLDTQPASAGRDADLSAGTLLLGTFVDPQGEPVEARLRYRRVLPLPLPPGPSKS